MKNYVAEFSKDFREYYKGVRESGKRLEEMIDNILVWLLSLSTGAIVLIISSIDKIKFTEKKNISVIVIILTASVVLGIIGRIAYAISIYLNNALSENMDSSLMANLVHYYPYTLRGNETSEEIYQLAKDSFDLDLTIIIDAGKSLTGHDKVAYDKRTRDFYEHLKESVKVDQQQALSQVIGKMNEALGVDLNSQAPSKEFAKRRRWWADKLQNIAYILFSTSAFLFILALIYSVMKFVGQ
ncbi:hypothetical protein [Flavisolibacter tropicus]|uniref:Uncharacterized protein n=1 Tax=Flavisolibacter tropicus TaxID=1492898 RepID=A0A172TUR1_9BACT|nr:hypothetical protein [Flavisolibacter tropicus]ANE50770.1 hypothetical protein SY85_09920 [Flavisolibacter tropicus]